MKPPPSPLVTPLAGPECFVDLPVPVIFHLSGRLRGTSQRLRGERLRLGTAMDAEVRVSPEPCVAPHHATLQAHGTTYRLLAEADQPVWVNGEPVRDRVLASGDVLEVGKDGPLLRFRLYPPGTRTSKSVAEAFSDGVHGARSGGGWPPARAARGLAGAVRELATQTALWFRVSMLLLVLILLASTGLLLVRSERLEKRLTREELRVQGLADLLEENERRLEEQDLAAVQSELLATMQRVEALELRTGAPARVVREASRSVMLLQGAYGFVQPQTGEPLRFAAVGPDGLPARTAEGDPIVGLGGDGPLVEVFFLGTAFIVSSDGLLLTNRHVVLPWQYDEAAQRVVAQGLEPKMHRFLGYLPEVTEPFATELVEASEEADLAILRSSEVAGRAPPLELRSTLPGPGDEVIVLGYPAGIRALLARSHADFVKELLEDRDVDFWEVARRLSEAGQIGPLASRGIVAQVSSAAVVYDAETTRGGSGGPVLDLDGEVLAVTSAVVSEFGGSNIGVPAILGRTLLDQAASAPHLTPRSEDRSPRP